VRWTEPDRLSDLEYWLPRDRKWKSEEVELGQQFFLHSGEIMDDIVNSAERMNASLQLPAVVIIEPLTLTRTCILSILRKELIGFEIIDTAATDNLDCASARDVRLVALSIADKSIVDPSVAYDLMLLTECCPNASITLWSTRDDEATALEALNRGIRGFFPTSLPIEVAVAGLRLVLAGGVYRPLPIVRPNVISRLEQLSPRGSIPPHLTNGASKEAVERTPIEFTPREQQVLAELEFGLPNKLIAAKLNLSENTVKMHVQHIMRKCAARNRTEAVLRWSGRLSGSSRASDASESSARECPDGARAR